jgi:integrase
VKDAKDRGLFERPKDSGIWWVRWKDAVGREHREKIGSKSAARQVWLKRKEDVRLGKKLGPLNRRPVTLEKLIADLLPVVLIGKKPKGRKAYEGYADYWVEALGDTVAEDLTPGDIERCKARLLDRLSPASTNRYLTFLRRLFTLAVRDQRVSSSPMASGRVRQLRENNQRDRYFSAEEKAKIQAAAAPSFWREINLLLLTGLRRSELLTLRRENVDLTRRRLKLLETKPGEIQFVRMNTAATAILAEILAEHDNPWVFPGRTGDTHREPSAFTRRFAKLLARLGIRNASIHTTRHTFISELAILGTPLPTLQKLARHKTIAMTLRYAHLCPDLADQALEALCGGTYSGTGFSADPQTKQ